MNELASQVQEQLKQVQSYKKQMKFIDNWQEYERFKAGDQWAKKTKRTANLPRPVFNVIQYIENHKICDVLKSEIKMLYTSSEADNLQAEEQAKLYTEYADNTYERIKQSQLNEEVLESASNLGTGIWHYYWDNEAQGGMNYPYIGEMKGEAIDPMNFFPGNPQQTKVQLQPYLLITSRDLVKNIKDYAKANGAKMEEIELITSDKPSSDDYEQATKEVSDSDKATIVTKYWKDKGTIWFMKVCGSVIIKPPTNTEMKLYPIAIMNWYKRKKSIFGIGDTESIIPNQKAINFLMAMQMLSVQLTGFPKLLVKRQWIKQSITNTPGEIIYDDNPGMGNSMEYMNPGAVTPLAQNLVDNFMQFTKDLAGATETSTGALSTNSQMNATAINLLQQAASVPLDGIKKRYYQAMEDVALIWEQFYKIYYQTTRQFEGKDEQGNPIAKTFNGSQAQGLEFNLKIDISDNTAYSDANVMAQLNTMLQGQYITFQQYLEYSPENAIPFKDKLLKDLAEQAQQQAEMQQAQDQQQIQDLQDKFLTTLSPAEQEAFKNASPQEQRTMLNQMSVPQPQQAPQQQQSQPTPQ